MRQSTFLNISFEPYTKLGELIDMSKGNNFQESFEQFGGLGTCSSYSVMSITNHVKIPKIQFCEKVNKGQ